MVEEHPPRPQHADTLTVVDAAEYLRVHRITVYRLVATGLLHPFKVGRFWRFPRSDIVAMTQKNAPLFRSRPVELTVPTFKSSHSASNWV
jgi:excisionase family DNA binding protein